jgi:hypothetical protein
MRVTYVEKTVTDYRLEVRPRTVTLNVPVWDVHEAPDVKREVIAPVWAKEKRVRTIELPKPRQVTRDVEECTWISECVTDPHTGCVHTISKPIVAVRTEKVTVWELQPVQEEYLADVVALTTADESFPDHRVIVDVKMTKTPQVMPVLVKVPYKKKIKVPVYTPYEETCPGQIERLPAPKPKDEKPGR